MSISPPTDIILDVARAADPARYQEAAERLTRISSTAPAEGFGEALKAAGPPPEAAGPVDTGEALNRMRQAPAAPRGLRERPGKAGQAYEGFEAVALTSFVQEMLPKQAGAVFGTGTAGDVWKSMLAEQIAAEMARAGGIGIADRLKAAHPADGPEKAKNGISRIGDAADKALAESAIVMSNQRSFLSTITPGGSLRDDPKAWAQAT
jgi:Rod binding domain-containing protein